MMNTQAFLYFLLFLVPIFTACLRSEPEVIDSPSIKHDLVDSIHLAASTDPYLRLNKWDSSFQHIQLPHGLDWMYLKAIMIKESHGQEDFISTAGAVGLMQLMPRQGSYITSSYKNYQAARKQQKWIKGQRFYKGKSEYHWIGHYRQELDSLSAYIPKQELHELDVRFNTQWNLQEGCGQFIGDFRSFRQRGHGPYTSRILATAAYNAGRHAVMRQPDKPKLDQIPINRQTELYVANVDRIYQELQFQSGLINENNAWILKL